MAKERIYRKPTIRNVADLAGVSVTTVSHVVSGVRSYAPGTVSKVNKAIRELNYTPSYIARGLRQESTMTLGVVGIDPLRIADPMRRRFSEELWRGIAAEADSHDYSLLSYSEKIRAGNDLTPFLNGLVDGVLMLNRTEDRRPLVLSEAGIPVVIQVRPTEQQVGVGAAYVDEAHLLELGLTHLWELGHRQIAHLGGPSHNPSPASLETSEEDAISTWRSDAYRDWMSARGVFNSEHLRFAGAWEPADVTMIVHEWMKQPNPPTAVVCANDFIAVRVFESASRLGWEIPNQLSVVGIDDIPAAKLPEYSLTTVRVPIEEVGRESVRSLLRMLSGEPGRDCRITLKASGLTLRNSSKRVQ